jgi:hypothetical protein
VYIRSGTLNALAKPKSASLIIPFESTRRFCGLKYPIIHFILFLIFTLNHDELFDDNDKKVMHQLFDMYNSKDKEIFFKL